MITFLISENQHTKSRYLVVWKDVDNKQPTTFMFILVGITVLK